MDDQHVLAELELHLEQGDSDWIATNHLEIIAALLRQCRMLQNQIDYDYWPQA